MKTNRLRLGFRDMAASLSGVVMSAISALGMRVDGGIQLVERNPEFLFNRERPVPRDIALLHPVLNVLTFAMPTAGTESLGDCRW